MQFKHLKYAAVLTGPVIAWISFTYTGWLTWLAPMYIFVFLPIAEMIIPASEKNLSDAEEEIEKNDRFYDYLLYAIIPVQFGLLIYFFYQIQIPGLSGWEIGGRLLTMGLLCAIFGINVAHELGHRAKKSEQLMSRILLSTSMNMHFFIEHNRGHHARVATEEDPVSAARGEILYFYWPKALIGEYMGAWRLEIDRLKKNGIPFFSIHNMMLRFQFIQTAMIVLTGLIFGWMAALYFVIAALIGILLLETINYVEHYGLRRRKKGDRYEPVKPIHSWNSNHALGRIMLFELTRHSDHHYKASRKYQILRHFDEAPQMPFGYPAMVVLSFFPPLFFYIMHKEIDRYKASEFGAALG